MIDWSKLGPSSSPGPAAPSTTVPVAPAVPGSLSQPVPTVPKVTPVVTGNGYHPLSQQQVDSLDPGERIGRGIDFLGDKLFGQNNGSLLGGVPLFGDIVGAAGKFGHGLGDALVAKPIEITAHVASSVPLGWLPGGADDNFNQIGEWAKTHDPQVYEKWQAVQALGEADKLQGGNLKANFNMEVAQYLDDQLQESQLGTTPTLALGRAGVGSLGGAFAGAITGWLGLASNTSQRALGGIGAFDPNGQHGGDNRLNRVEESAARLDAGQEVSDIEKQAVEAWRSGAWSMNHAQDFLVSHGQGITRNPIGQAIGSALLDPLTYATVGAGSIAKAGQVGARIAEAGGEATTVYQKLGKTVYDLQSVQTPIGKELGGAFRIARGLIDPLAVYKPSTVQRAVTDMFNGAAINGFWRGYGPKTVQDMRAIGRELGKTSEMDSDIASYSIDQATLLAARKVQRDALNEGLGIELVHSNVDDIAGTVAQNAGRDAETEMTDHILTISKNTFTAEEDASLAGRIAASYGGDAATWSTRIKGMANELKSALHAVTYKRAEVEFEQARSLIKPEDYKGDLPLANMVLMSRDTLDNVTAEGVINDIRAILKDENTPAKIAAATEKWNAEARRYPAMENIGYAPGGQEQLTDLVNELEKTLKGGGLSRRATEEELNDPALRSIRDMLDRHTLPADQVAEPIPGTWTKHPWAEPVSVEWLSKMTPHNPTTEAHIEQLMKSIEERGFDSPIEMAYSQESKAIIQDEGTHRLEAARRLGLEEVPVTFQRYRHALNEAAVERGNTMKVPGIEPDEFGYVRGNLKPSEIGVPVGKFPAAKPLWNVGFRPDEEVAWGLKRERATGRYIIDRDPTISHVVNATPGRQPFSDTTRNVLGQIIGKSKAERLNKPIDSIEAYANTLRDGVTGQRLVKNMERRFEKSTFDAGIPKPISKEIWAKARDVAGLDYTTIRGIKPGNLWEAVADIVPRDLKLADGTYLNEHVIMDHLLEAAEGDLRIMGVTSVLSQRMRNQLREWGDGSNWAGQMTVTMYNKLRYAQPMFLIQRITDAPYYSILYGVTPVGKGALSEANKALQAITDNLGRTGLARHFSMDMPEFATRANFTNGIKSAMQQAGLLEHKLDKIIRAPDEIIANNMTNMLHARLGDMVRGALENLAKAAEKDPALKAEMLQAGDVLTNSFADWRRIYSEQAGRVLDDNEVGLRYLQDQLNGWRRVVNEDGTLNFDRILHEGEMAMPSDIGSIGPIRPDMIAQRLGYPDALTLRNDVTGQLKKIEGEYIKVPGEHDIAWLEERMRTELRAHPDTTRRAVAYFGDTWDNFWSHLEQGVEVGGLDISPHYAKEAQDLIAIWARDRGMDPWEYLSGVMATNIGAKDLETHMGQLMAFLKSGKAQQPLEEWTKIFRSTLDVSAQKDLLREFESAVNVEDVLSVPTPGAAGVDAKGNAVMPKGYTADPGYVYRIESLTKARGGWPKKTGVSVKADPFYFDGSPGQGVFRTKMDPAKLSTTGAVTTGGANGLTPKHIPPEQIEMLDPSGNWVALTPDPMDTIMAKDFPEAVRQRLLSDTEHPNPEVESYIRQFSKWVQDSIQGELGSRTRSDLRRLVEQVPTAGAVPYNRSQALVISLLKNKIEDAQQDVFRLAEMQTKRTVLERSLNHPLFGLYPASYMWGKVLPETVKFLAKNPYAATYTIANVQRSIAIQREYDHDIEDKISAVDRSAGAFLLDYLTPGLPWSDHEARMSPMVRDIFNGKPEMIWPDELRTVDPRRWVNQVSETVGELPGAIDTLTAPAAPPQPSWAKGLQNLQGAPAANGATAPAEITGPTRASALAPILSDDLSRLQSILLQGESPEQ